MDFGVSTLIDFNVPFEARLDLFKSAGMKRIAISEERSLPLSQPDSLRFVKDALRKRSLSVEHVHGPISTRLDFTSSDRDIVDGTLAIHRQVVRATAELGSSMLVVHVSSYPDLEYQDLYETTKRAIGHLLDLIEYARPFGVDIVIENQPYRYRSERVIDQIIEEFPKSELKVCIDTCHIVMGNPEPLLLLENWAEYIVTTHLSDSNGLADEHLIPGSGQFPWTEGIAILKNAGRIKFLTFENSSWGAESFEPYLERTLLAGEWLCQLWEKVDAHTADVASPRIRAK
ncbi:sugar phosphate isomerase/epimerase [bacterium]|nr:sugar phosphate isomerase/epimerase [bacterium]